MSFLPLHTSDFRKVSHSSPALHGKLLLTLECGHLVDAVHLDPWVVCIACMLGLRDESPPADSDDR